MGLVLFFGLVLFIVFCFVGCGIVYVYFSFRRVCLDWECIVNEVKIWIDFSIGCILIFDILFYIEVCGEFGKV